MSRPELQRLALERVRDAEILLNGGQWSGAYYLAGYAIEFALKSCILHHIERTGRIFKDRKYLTDLGKCWVHELDQLLYLADLDGDLGAACGANATLRGYWGVVKDWKETSRYEVKTEKDARDLYKAITDKPDGVLQWIQTHW